MSLSRAWKKFARPALQAFVPQYAAADRALSVLRPRDRGGASGWDNSTGVQVAALGGMTLPRLPAPSMPRFPSLPGGAVRTLPGAAATVGMMGAGWVIDQLTGKPVKVSKSGRPIKRRAKGITANELKGFTRVTRILDKYAKTKPPMKHAARRGAPFKTKRK